MSSMYPPYGGGAPAGQTCQRCGAPLPPNEVYCRNCGQYNAPAAPGPATGYGQDAYSGAGSQWAQPGTSPSYADPTVAQSPYGSAPNDYYGASTQAASAPPYGSAPSYQPAPGGFQSGGYPPPGGYPAPGGYPPPQKSGPNVGLIVGIAILLLVLIGGGIGAVFLLNRHNTPVSNVTPTAHTTSPTPSTPALFSDTFQNNNNGWDLTSVPGKYSVKVGGGSMILEDDDNHILPEMIPGKTFNDFKLTVSVAITKGTQDNSGCGVYIRGASNSQTDLATYYRFALYGDGTYAIYKGSVDSSGNPQPDQRLVNVTSNNAIKPVNGVNQLEIDAKGPTMTMTVNGQKLNTITDNSYQSGTISLYVSNLQDAAPGAAATFTNLAIYPAS